MLTHPQGRGLTPVGASLLAMDVNENAFFLTKRVALKVIASKLAPTKVQLLGDGVLLV
jgi:hypothetical protein